MARVPFPLACAFCSYEASSDWVFVPSPSVGPVGVVGVAGVVGPVGVVGVLGLEGALGELGEVGVVGEVGLVTLVAGCSVVVVSSVEADCSLDEELELDELPPPRLSDLPKASHTESSL